MLSNFSQNHNADSEYDDDDDIDVESTGPEIASAQKNKMLVIIAAAALIAIVIYFFFLKEEKQVKEDIVEVAPPTKVTTSTESPFELEEIAEQPVEEDETIAIEKPAVPEVPTLPELPEESILGDSSIFPEEETKEEVKKPEEKAPETIEPEVDNQNNNPVPPSSPEKQTGKQPLQAVAPLDPELDPRYAPIIVFSAKQGGPGRSVGYERNIVDLNKNPIDALEDTAIGVTATHISDLSHTIAQGKLLTAVLETAINTEIPGLVRAIVSRDVYGEAGNDVLIPRGSRLFGSYSSQIIQGQGRVEISWTRLIRPDGVDLAINFNASDQFGRSGISGDVDNRFGSLIANSVLSSVLAVGGIVAAESLLDNAKTTTTTDPTTGTTTSTGSASSQALYDVSKTILDTVGTVIGNKIDIKPVIRVPQGTRITVIVNADIVVPSIQER